MDKLICLLLAIEGVSKNVHYNISDYSIHLLADRMQDGLNDFVDEIKENCIIAKGQHVKNSAYYLSEASKFISEVINLQELKSIIINTLMHIETIDNLSIGDDDLLGRIGTKLQNNLAILNIVLGEQK